MPTFDDNSWDQPVRPIQTIKPTKGVQNNTEPVQKATHKDPEPEEAKDESKIELSKATFLRPSSGYECNKTADVEVSVRIVAGSPDPKVQFHLFSIYKGVEEDMNLQAEGSIQSNKATASLKLAYNSKFYDDLNKGTESNVEYFFKADHFQSTGSAKSPAITLPDTGNAKDSEAQAAVLTQASEDGSPLCEECEKNTEGNEDGVTVSTDEEESNTTSQDTSTVGSK